MPTTDRMDLQRADAYGRSFAEVYDDWYQHVTDEAATARFVAELCGAGPVLELGVGSGRLAKPLASSGVNVIGLDGSRAMLDECRRHTADDPVRLVEADMRALPFRRASPTSRPTGALIAFNTLYNVSNEEEQRQLIIDIGELLAPGGVLIVEALDVASLRDGPPTSLGVGRLTENGLVISATQVERSSQVVTGQHIEISDDGLAIRPWMIRWLTADQLDGWAIEAGLRLESRCSDWHGKEFRPGDDTHISVYRSEV